MNEITAVRQPNVCGSEIPTDVVKNMHAILGVYAHHLNEIAKLAYVDARLASQRLQTLILPNELMFLKDAVWTNIIWCKHAERCVSERTISDHFFKNLIHYLPNAIQYFAAINPNHRPDGFVRYDEFLCPVEVKLNDFNVAAKRQLLRYMRVYKSKKGIAVAQSLTCNLPKNIVFCKVDINAEKA